jgi:hypothetical protein
MEWTRRHRPSPGTAFGFAALVIALGGVAFAAIPDSNGTIHACYQKNSGNLRVVDSSHDCRPSERALSWNQRGPQGATGAAGPAGPTGATGPRGATGLPGATGASTVYEDHVVELQSIAGGVYVASITVPAGRYLVSAKTSAEDASGIRNFVQCGLDGAPFEPVNEAARATLPPNGASTVTVLATIDVAVETQIRLFCNPSFAANARFAVLTATSVGTVVRQ